MDLRIYDDGHAVFGVNRVRCVVGRSGLIAAHAKREGDGATPIGHWAVRRVLYRADRRALPHTRFQVRALLADDGWCDDPTDPAYNRPVRLPYPARHEVMMRDDPLYDVVVVLAHNDAPPVAGAGSAIFLHCAKRTDQSPAQPDDTVPWTPTAGCVALAAEDLEAFLAQALPGDGVDVQPGPLL